MGIANVIQTATSATHHHHHHTELPKISSKPELFMKSQRVKKKKTPVVWVPTRVLWVC
jgi:hypothetical protein